MGIVDTVINGIISGVGIGVQASSDKEDRKTQEGIARDTNASNEKIASDTNESNERIAQQTNEMNAQISDATNQANAEINKQTNETNERISDKTNAINKEIAEKNLQYQKEYNEKIWEREDQQAEKQFNFMLEHGINPLSQYAVQGMGSGGSAQAPQNGYEAQGYTAQGYTAEGYTAQGYTAEGYTAIPPSITKSEIGNSIMALRDITQGMYTNEIDKNTAEGVKLDNEGKKIENEYKNQQILLDLQEQMGRLEEQKDKHLISQAQYEEMNKTLDLKIKQIQSQINLTNKQAGKTEEETKTEKTQRHTNEVMSAITQDLNNEQLDFARQTHEDRIKQTELETEFKKLNNYESKVRMIKNMAETGQIISSEIRNWAQYNLTRKNTKDILSRKELQKILMLINGK